MLTLLAVLTVGCLASLAALGVTVRAPLLPALKGRVGYYQVRPGAGTLSEISRLANTFSKDRFQASD